MKILDVEIDNRNFGETDLIVSDGNKVVGRIHTRISFIGNLVNSHIANLPDVDPVTGEKIQKDVVFCEIVQEIQKHVQLG